MSARRVPVVLSIAGSDSGGGAGIQADVKAFARAGVHGATAITALTAQNTVGVEDVLAVPTEFVKRQVRAVAGDLGVDAVKIGMLGDAPVVAAVAEVLDELPEGTPVVVDPVMVAESGARLLPPDAERALVDLILPRATVATPNVPEARALTRARAGDAASGQAAAARAISRPADENEDPEPRGEHTWAEDLVRGVRALGPDIVVLTGGHRDAVTDLFFDGEQVVAIEGERYPDGAAHGSGCTHSSTLAARLALGDSPVDAARAAKATASAAVRDGLRELGAGAGPVDVFTLGGGVGALP